MLKLTLACSCPPNQMLCEFNSVQEFWRYFEHIPKPSKVFSEFVQGNRYTVSPRPSVTCFHTTKLA